MTKNASETVYKIVGLVLVVVLTVVVWVWGAADLASSVGQNTGEINLLKPVVRQNEISIENLKSDVAHNSAVQQQMIELQKVILDEVRK